MNSNQILMKKMRKRYFKGLNLKNYNNISNSLNFRYSTSKKNWSEEETNLLRFAIVKYCRAKSKQVHNLTNNDWKEIADMIPGRTES